jgi:hypothetical protein
MSTNLHADDAEGALLPPDETMNVQRNLSDCEHSHSYQYDADDEAEDQETPLVELASTQLFYETERE